MNQEDLNRVRRMAGLAPSYNGEERHRLNETKAKHQEIIEEAANNRPSSKIIADIAKQHLHVRSLAKTGEDGKDYHDCPCWAIEAALKAAFKAGQGASKAAPVKEAVENLEEKKADKDHDEDGEVESEEAEHKGSVDKAIKKSKKKDKKDDDDDKKDDDSDDKKEVDEGSSEGYDNPKGTKLTAAADSGASAKKGDCCKAPHKDDSKSAKSEDKGKKGLKKIGEKAEEASVWDTDHENNRPVDQLKAADVDGEKKITVPSSHKTSLSETISQLRKESETCRIRDPLGAEFYENTANAFEMLLGHLKEGTQRSLLLAQIDLNRCMGPMQQRLPTDVYMYIVRGGKPAALTELFKEVKLKKDGADLSTGNLAK